MDFKDKLKALRKERGETAEKVAKNLGISRSAYSNYEQGLRLPDFFMIVKLASYFEVSADYLLGLSAV